MAGSDQQVGRRQRDRDHERRIQHDARTDEARRAFFIDYTVWLHEWLVWSQDVYHLVTGPTLTPGRALPPLPEHPVVPQDATLLTAQRAIFGTPELDAAHNRFIAAIGAFGEAEGRLRAKTETGKLTASDLHQLQGSLNRSGGEILESVLAIQGLIRHAVVGAASAARVPLGLCDSAGGWHAARARLGGSIVAGVGEARSPGEARPRAG